MENILRLLAYSEPSLFFKGETACTVYFILKPKGITGAEEDLVGLYTGAGSLVNSVRLQNLTGLLYLKGKIPKDAFIPNGRYLITKPLTITAPSSNHDQVYAHTLVQQWLTKEGIASDALLLASV